MGQTLACDTNPVDHHAFSLDRGRRLPRQLCLSDPPGVSRTRQLWREPVFILAFCEGAGLPRSRTNLEYRRRVQMRTDNQAAKSKSNTNTTLRSSWLMRGTTKAACTRPVGGLAERRQGDTPER